MNLKENLNKIVSFAKKRWILVAIAAVVILAVVFSLIYFSLKMGKAEAKQSLPEIKIEFSNGALDSGNGVLVHPLSPSSTEYTQLTTMSSFVGTPYVLSWKSGIDSMSRAPIKVLIPIPSKYYIGNNEINLEGAELIGTQLQTLYGGQFEEINNLPYLEVLTYFPGTLILRLKSGDAQYGLIPIGKISNLQPNLVIVPGENMNFSGNVPGSSFNIWVQSFPNYNIYLFVYPLIYYRDYSITAQITSYFGSSSFDSYTQYMGNYLSTLLSTLQGNTYIVAQGIGGLVTRYAVQSNPSAGNVKRVVLFDTPNLGTTLASAYTVSNLYNAGTEFLSREFQISDDSIDFILSSAISYLYSINFFAKDLSPNSSFLSRLNSMPVPSNITFMSVAGTSSGISIKNFGALGSTFPELMDGYGDGIVSVKSALAFGNIKLQFPHAFSDIFAHSSVMNEVQKFLTTSIATALTFTSDNSPQTIQSSKVSTVSTRVMTYKYLSSGDYIVKEATQGSFLQRTYSVPVPEAKNFYVLSGGIYLISNDSISYLSMGGQSTIYSGGVRFANVYGNRFYAVTDNWQILEFNGSYSILDGSATPGDYRRIFVENDKIYTLSNGATSTYFKENGKLLLKIPGIDGLMWYMPSNDVFVIISNSYIAVYDMTNKVGTFFESISDLMSKAKLGQSESLLPFNSVYVSDNTMYLLSSNYILLAVDLKTHGLQIIGNNDVGNEKLSLLGRDLTVVGDRTLNFYDLINRVRIPVYQQMRSKIIDSQSFESSLYLLTERSGTYEIEIYGKN